MLSEPDVDASAVPEPSRFDYSFESALHPYDVDPSPDVEDAGDIESDACDEFEDEAHA